MLDFIKNRLSRYDANHFVNELAYASKCLGILEAKIDAYQFDSILVPMLHKKEAISSMYIEGTQTTISDVLENEVNPKNDQDKIMIEVDNHIKTLVYGADYLMRNNFTHSFIQNIHKKMLTGLLSEDSPHCLGKYKTSDNCIVSSAGTVVFIPPSHLETKKYMDELISFMNEIADELHPLIKAAIIHSQFESIHPFSDGNGRVGRMLISLYLFKAKVINFPFFYISEAISQDKNVYYNMLTDSRNNSYDNWIRYFLKKIIVQAKKHIEYIDKLNSLYSATKKTVKNCINSPKFDSIIECLFTQPVLNADLLSDKITVSRGQAIRYLNILENEHVLFGDDKKRGRKFYFVELLELVRQS